MTRLKLVRSILLDLLGLLLAVGAGTYLGGRAGIWAGSYGPWTGIAAGINIGFAAAFGMKSLWGRIMKTAGA